MISFLRIPYFKSMIFAKGLEISVHLYEHYVVVTFFCYTCMNTIPLTLLIPVSTEILMPVEHLFSEIETSRSANSAFKSSCLYILFTNITIGKTDDVIL